ncbi:hypothetical protein EDD15DRAFT_2193508 [Pisolithus albus]|nr:hypothetical protein EDD15DRAFT_2193508 [Pisolithus albus]
MRGTGTLPGRRIGVAVAGEVLPKLSLKDPEAREIVHWLFFEEWVSSPPCFGLPFLNKMPCFNLYIREVRHLFERGAMGCEEGPSNLVKVRDSGENDMIDYRPSWPVSERSPTVSRRDPGLRTCAMRLNTIGKNINPVTIQSRETENRAQQDSVGEIQAQPLRHSFYQHSQLPSPSAHDKRISTVIAPKPGGTCLGRSACNKYRS